MLTSLSHVPLMNSVVRLSLGSFLLPVFVLGREPGERLSDSEMIYRDNMRSEQRRTEAIRQSINGSSGSSSNQSSAYRDVGNALSGTLHKLGQQLTSPVLSEKFLAESERRWQEGIKKDEEARI